MALSHLSCTAQNGSYLSRRREKWLCSSHQHVDADGELPVPNAQSFKQLELNGTTSCIWLLRSSSSLANIKTWTRRPTGTLRQDGKSLANAACCKASPAAWGSPCTPRRVRLLWDLRAPGPQSLRTRYAGVPKKAMPKGQWFVWYVCIHNKVRYRPCVWG